MKKFLNKFLLIALTLAMASSVFTAVGSPIRVDAKAKAAKSASEKVNFIKQTGATKSSISLVWNKVNNAVKYKVRANVYAAGAASYSMELYSDKNSIKINGLRSENNIYITVSPIGSDQNVMYGAQGVLGGLKTTPNKVRNLMYNKFSPFAHKNKLSLRWDSNLKEDGVFLSCYTKSGKRIQRFSQDAYKWSADFRWTNTRNCYKVYVTPYVKLKNNNKKAFGPTTTKYAVPQPEITSTRKDVGRRRIRVKWRSVRGASRYEVWVGVGRSVVSTPSYRKVATVKSPKYLLSRFRGYRIDTKRRYYFIKVVTVAKFGKKTIKSGRNMHIWARSY